MLKEEKNLEMTRQFEDIFREHTDPLIIEKKKIKERREKNKQEKKEDLGL